MKAETMAVAKLVKDPRNARTYNSRNIDAIGYSSKPDENVLELFGGSGSTLIAAEQTGRKCFAMELDPLYCDVIVQRYETFTAKKAKRKTNAKHVKAAAK